MSPYLESFIESIIGSLHKRYQIKLSVWLQKSVEPFFLKFIKLKMDQKNICFLFLFWLQNFFLYLKIFHSINVIWNTKLVLGSSNTKVVFFFVYSSMGFLKLWPSWMKLWRYLNFLHILSGCFRFLSINWVKNFSP